MYFKRIIASFALAFTFFSSSYAQAPAGKELTIAMRLVSPFVMKEGQELTGFSVELWDAIAKEMGRNYKAVPKETLKETFDDVKSGKADAAIAAISITSERERDYDFSQPMFDAGLQLMVSADRATPPSLFSSLIEFFKSKNFQEMALLFVGLMLIPVPLLWLFENKKGDLIGHDNFLGQLSRALWWSSSTLGAQATQMPTSILGRILAVCWMLVSVVFISFFTATFTAGLTVKQLESNVSGFKELAAKKVASVKGSTGAAFLKTTSVDRVEVNNIEEAYKKLLANEIVGIVYDAPILLYYAANEGAGKVAMVGNIFQQENYGILLAEGNPLRKEVNAALLRVREKGDYQKLYTKWFVPKKD